MTTKRIISVCLVIAMACSFVTPAMAAEISDAIEQITENLDSTPDTGEQIDDKAEPPVVGDTETGDSEEPDGTVNEENNTTEEQPTEDASNETDIVNDETNPNEAEVAPPVEEETAPVTGDTEHLGMTLGLHDMLHDMLDTMEYLDVQTFIHLFDGLTQEEIQLFFDYLNGTTQEEMVTVVTDLLEMFDGLEPEVVTEQMRLLLVERGDISLYSNYNVGTSDVSLSSGGTHTIYSSLGQTQSTHNITARGNRTYYITLNGSLGQYLRVTSNDRPAFLITGGATVYLTLSGNSRFESTGAYAGIQVDSGSTLYITDASTGTVETYGGTDQYYSGAGIGGASKSSNGQITINGGFIYAYGGNKPYYGAAGIGSGAGATTASNITINGGHVQAHGSQGAHLGAAGIGGGANSSASNITIAQANSSIATGVTAYPSTEAGSNGAAIGGGFDGAATNITITGGIVSANNNTGASGLGGAGIGSGGSSERNHAIASKIYISGGTVTAYGNAPGAGIGGGANNDGVDIRITGNANVTAYGGYFSDTNGAGIGGGSRGDGKDILINTSGTVSAYNNGSYSAGIGGGYYGNGENITIQGAPAVRTTVTAEGGSYGAGVGGGYGGYGVNIDINHADMTIGGHYGAGIGAGFDYRPSSNTNCHRYEGSFKNAPDMPSDATVVTNIKIRNSSITARNGQYYGAFIGTGGNSYGTPDDKLYAVIDCEKTTIKYQQHLYEAPVIGAGYSCNYSDVDVKIKDCAISAECTSTWNYGVGIGCGTSCNNSTLHVLVDNCDDFDFNITSGTGIGIGRDCYNMTADFTIRNCDNMTTQSPVAYTTTDNGYPYGSGAGIGTAWSVRNSQLTFNVENCTGIDLSTKSGTAIGLGENNYGNTAEFHFANCGNIEASSDYGVGIGVGTKSYNNTAEFTFAGCGDITVNSAFDSSIGTEGQALSSVGIGIGSKGFGNNVTVTVSDCGNLSVDTNANHSTDVGTGANAYNNVFHATFTGDKSHTIILDGGAVAAGTGYFNVDSNGASEVDITMTGYNGVTAGASVGFGTGSGSNTAYNPSSSVYKLKTKIKLENCGNIEASCAFAGFGVGQEAYTQNDGILETQIDILSCGNITTHASSGVGIGTGRLTSGKGVRTNINIDNCGDIYAENCAYAGIGTADYVGSRRVDNNAITNITISNSGNITASAQNTGIGAGPSQKYGGKTTVKINSCGAVTAQATGANGVAIGAGYNNGSSEGDAHQLDIDILSCDSVTAIASANSIGIGAYRDGNNINTDILIQNSGEVKALVGDENMTSGNGVGIGIGHTSTASNSASIPVNVHIVNCDSITARGSRYGAGIGTGRNVSTATGEISITGTKTINASAGKDAPAIGIGYNGGANLTVDISIEDAAVTALSKGTDGYGAAAIGTAYGCRNGRLELNLSKCTINAHSDNGPAIGLGRKNESKQTVCATLTDCAGTCDATGYSAGIGQGLENANTIMELHINGGSVTANGSKGGAGIGTGPVNTGCSFVLEISGNANVTATGSVSLDNELEVLGSTGNQILDQLAQNRVMGAGAGIGGSDGTQVLSLKILSGIVTARGASTDIYSSAGIGGGSSGNGGAISIMGGAVNAYGSERGAAIGGGSRGVGGEVNILGGVVVATGGQLSPAIGGGAGAADNGTLLLGDGRLAKYAESSSYPSLSAYSFPVNQPAIKASVTTDNVKLLQGTMLEPIDEARSIRIRSGSGNDSRTLSLPAGYDAFAATVSADLADGISYSVYTDALKNGVSTEYKLATAADSVEDFPVNKAASYLAERLTLIIFYDVTFETDGGSTVAKQQVRGGKTADMPSDPTKRGFAFAGWYTDTARETPYDFSEAVNQDIVLYAKWVEAEKLPYTVQHWKQTLDGDYALSNIEYLFGDDGQAVTAEAKDFEGFHTISHSDEVTGGTLRSGAPAPVLKCYYDRDIITVELRNIEITEDTQTSITAMWGSQIILTEPTKNNWEFTQWTKGDKNGEVVPTFTPVRIETLGNILYANFSLRGGAQYLVRDFLRNIDGSYTMVREEEYADVIGTEITATAREYEGYVLNKSISDETSHGIVQKDGSTVLKLYYDRISVNIKLLNGFLDITEVTRLYGEKAELPTPSRDGYRFDGWFTKEGAKVTDDALIQNIGDAVSARWTAADTTKYSVRYYLQNQNGQYVVHEVNDLAAETGSTAKAQVKTFNGYTFNADKSTVVGTVVGNGTLVLSMYYDINTYSVTYVSNCDTEIPKQSGLYYGQLLTAPKTPTRAGYTFAGWYIDRDLGVEWVFRADTLKADTTLYAKWERVSVTVALEDAYMDISEITRYHGEAANLPTPSRTGYRFDGWFMANGNKVSDNALIQNIGETVTARWTAAQTTKYTVRYYREKEDGTFAIYEISDLSGETDKTVNAQIKQYTGYSYNKDKSTVSGTVDATGSLVLSVYYNINKFTVSFDTAGGSKVSSLKDICYGSHITEPETPQHDGYSFGGWYLDKTCTDQWKFRSDSVDKDITLYAKWLPVSDTSYTVIHYTANKNGGYDKAYTENLAGQTDSEVTATARTFPGFVEDTDNAKRVPSGIIKGDGTLTLALYYKRAIVTVTFKAGNQDTDVTTQQVFWGDKVAKPEDPKKSGFKCWLGPNGEEYDFETPVTENITLTAKFISSGGGGAGATTEFTVSFVTGCDTEVPSQTVAANKHAVRPANLQKIGFELVGWYTDKNFSKVFDFEKNVVNDNMTLYAKWEFAAPALLNAKDHIAYIMGRGNGMFDADAQITRGEVAEIFYRLLTEEVREERETEFNTFSDVDDHWAALAISTLANIDVVHGYADGTFRPNAPITRAEYATMLINLYRAKTLKIDDSFSDIEAHWAREFINTASELGLVFGYEDNTFQPDKSISRAEAVTMMNRILRRACDENTVLDGYRTFDDIQTNDWFYWNVIEAANGHKHELKTGVEYWTEIQ